MGNNRSDPDGDARERQPPTPPYNLRTRRRRSRSRSPPAELPAPKLPRLHRRPATTPSASRRSPPASLAAALLPLTPTPTPRARRASEAVTAANVHVPTRTGAPPSGPPTLRTPLASAAQCLVCADDLQAGSVPGLQATCGHQHAVCADCAVRTAELAFGASRHGAEYPIPCADRVRDGGLTVASADGGEKVEADGDDGGGSGCGGHYTDFDITRLLGEDGERLMDERRAEAQKTWKSTASSDIYKSFPGAESSTEALPNLRSAMGANVWMRVSDLPK
ncbi:hypothetical protein HK405_005694, partial [Cladochytrium tenue]